MNNMDLRDASASKNTTFVEIDKEKKTFLCFFHLHDERAADRNEYMKINRNHLNVLNSNNLSKQIAVQV